MHRQNKNLVLELKYDSRLGYTKVCNHPQPPTNTHSHKQPSTTTKKPPTTTCNYPKNHPQPSTAIYNHPKITQKGQDLSQTVMLLHFRCSYWNRRWVSIVIRNNGIYTCVSVCLSTLQVITFNLFWLGWLFVFVSLKSNSFDVKSDGFCLLKIWIYELLLINIQQRSVQQSTISAHELLYEFLRIRSIFRGKFYCLSLAIVAVDINVETLKRNGILLSKFAQNFVEARFLRNITGWDYLGGNWFKIKFPEIWLHLFMTVFP